MKNKLFVMLFAATLLCVTNSKAQSYFAAELTVKGVYAYVQMPEGTKAIEGKLLKGNATEITQTQFKAIIAGEKVEAIMINGVSHVPPVRRDGGYKWCSYETPSGGTSYYQCKIPKDGSDCCTMVIELKPVETTKD